VPRLSPKGAIDLNVGARIRARREALAMSQDDLANKAGVSYQQIQKYEIGASSVPLPRLVTVAAILGVEVGYFFEEGADK
jgi:transcriptional regulator with XRE-family HTH domain